jgi:hypothetical protein
MANAEPREKCTYFNPAKFSLNPATTHSLGEVSAGYALRKGAIGTASNSYQGVFAK